MIKRKRYLLKISRTKGEKEMTIGGQVKGWSLSGSNPELFGLVVDTTVYHTGTQSGLLYAKNEANERQFATMMQGFQARSYKGKRLKLSCFLKTENVGKCGAWFQIDNSSGDPIQFDNMDNRSIRGTTDWNQYALILDVLEDSTYIQFGVLLKGRGKVWADGFRFEEVSKKTSLTNILSEENLPAQPMNLDFSK